MLVAALPRLTPGRASPGSVGPSLRRLVAISLAQTSVGAPNSTAALTVYPEKWEYIASRWRRAREMDSR